jgi:hypothetical protein
MRDYGAVIRDIEAYVESHPQLYMPALSSAKRKRGKQRTPSRDYSNHQWMIDISHPDVSDPSTYKGKLFRRRFRVPFTLFADTIVPRMRDAGVFQQKRHVRIPIEVKVLLGLRVLGRDNDLDTMNEISGVSESYAREIFHQFLDGFVSLFKDDHVYFPKEEELHRINEVYRRMGLPGACGSMDCTHVLWHACPLEYKNMCKGKEGVPTLSFLVIVDHNRRVLYCSGAYFGAASDKQIYKDDRLCQALEAGLLSDIEYTLYAANGQAKKHKGGWLLVDGGFEHTQLLICPQRYRTTADEIVCFEWLESVRKDVECTFGILKGRFRFLRNGVRYHSLTTIEQAMHTACALHNMLLESDGHTNFTNWETNIDWNILDPDKELTTEEEHAAAAAASTTAAEEKAGEGEEEEPIQPLRLNAHFTASADVDHDWTQRPEYISDGDRHAAFTDALVTSFAVQRHNGDVRWPASFDARKRGLFPERFISRLGEQQVPVSSYVYVRESDLRVVSTQEKIGKGLFASRPIAKKTHVGQFTGTVTEAVAYDRLPRERQGYALQMTENRVLDCFTQAKSGACLMSMANQPHNCYNVCTGLPATANCGLIVSSKSKGYFRLVATKDIGVNEELLWPYGPDYK